MRDFHGIGLEYIWKEVDEISNKEKSNSIIDEEKYGIIYRKVDWSNIYGELDEGEYDMKFISLNSYYIKITFTINENGNINEYNCSFGW